MLLLLLASPAQQLSQQSHTSQVSWDSLSLPKHQGSGAPNVIKAAAISSEFVNHVKVSEKFKAPQKSAGNS